MMTNMERGRHRHLRGIALASALALGAAMVPSVALAADNYNPPPQIPSTAQCGTGASSGSFGAFGPGMNFGNTTSGHVQYPGNAQNGNGADGPGTGSNNSGVCGAV